MIHLYCGEGKGKTTAAMGLALRMAGRGQAVLIAQFLKSEQTGERFSLGMLPGVTLLPLPPQHKFVSQMTQREKEEERLRCGQLLDDAAAELARQHYGLLVLDEVCGALNQGMLSLERVLQVLQLCSRQEVEVVLTGRNPAPALTEKADYITLMEKVRHPFDKGTAARRGVEF